jgi:hypothetical protein
VALWRNAMVDFMSVSSSSLVGVTPVRVTARKPGGRLAGRAETGRVNVQRRKPDEGELGRPQYDAKPPEW